jgi:hypothetical protein
MRPLHCASRLSRYSTAPIVRRTGRFQLFPKLQFGDAVNGRIRRLISRLFQPFRQRLDLQICLFSNRWRRACTLKQDFSDGGEKRQNLLISTVSVARTVTVQSC